MRQSTQPQLSEAHLRLVDRELQKVLRALPSGCFDPEDGRSAGYEGLVEAMGRFDPRFGVSFERYARPRVRGAIIDGLRALTPFGRAGYRQLKELYRTHMSQSLNQTQDQADQGSSSELSIELETSFSELRNLAMSLCIEVLELNPQVDLAESMNHELDQAQERQRLSEAFEQLTESDQELIVACYDLRQVGDGVRPFAQRNEISPAAVSQRLQRAMKRLRILVFQDDTAHKVEVKT